MEFVWCLISAFIGSIVFSIIFCKESVSGTLEIDTSNPEKDLYRFDIKDDLNKLHTKKYIILKVDPKANLSQK